MRSQIGVPNGYSLSITQTGKVTLRSASSDYACTFTPVFASSGFTTYGQRGTYTCEHELLEFRCSNGTLHGILSFGEDISGRVSGTQMTGTWDATWYEEMPPSGYGVEAKAQFTGTR
jgi:hypothetical protein